MNKLMGRMVILLSVLAMSACGTLGGRVKGNYKFDSSNKNGLVVVSTKLVDQCGRVGGLSAKIFRKDEHGLGTDLIVKNFLMKPDIGDDGYFAVYEFPEGNYTIGNVYATGLTLSARIAYDQELLTFPVTAGSTTYIGEVVFTVVKGCGGVNTDVNNEWARDAKLFELRVKNIPSSSVALTLAK